MVALDGLEWLNEEFIMRCLKNDPESSPGSTVKDLHAEYLVPKGSNFTSIILLLTFTEQFKSGSGAENEKLQDVKKKYVIKVLSVAGPMSDVVKHLYLYEKEQDMYQRMIPAFHSILGNVGIKKKFSCRCYLTDNKKKVIAMEYLCDKGYRVRNKRVELDMEHTKIVLEKMALFHAASMRYYEMNKTTKIPTFYKKGAVINWDLVENLSDLVKNFAGKQAMINALKGFLESVRHKPQFKESVDFLDKVTESHVEYTLKTFETKPDNIFNVQLHGDCWTNNYLFSYDDNEHPTDVMFVDLQMSFYGSLAVDFVNFMSMCIAKDISCNKFQEVAEIYFNYLIASLETVEYRGIKPTFEQFQDEVKRNLFVAIFTINFIIPITITEVADKEQNSTHAGLIDIMESEHQLHEEKDWLVKQKQESILYWLQNEKFIEYFTDNCL